MKGDFSADRFDPAKNYTRVLKQQGRVELDSDWNEQAAIQQHFLRRFIVDLLGPAAGPVDDCGFGLDATGNNAAVGDFRIGAGRYYVDGLMIETGAIAYSHQPFLKAPPRLEIGRRYLAYLDVWERHVTALEDPDIREVALGGPDTCTRAQTVWQLRTLDTAAEPVKPPPPPPVKLDPVARRQRIAELEKLIAAEKVAARRRRLEAERDALAADTGTPVKETPPITPPAGRNGAAEIDCTALLQPLRDMPRGTLTAAIPPGEPSDSPCVLPPESRYRGLENQLYRVEIHASGATGDPNHVPTFKWSRDNGAVATAWIAATGKDVQVASTRGFVADGWVEIADPAADLAGAAGWLGKVVRVEGDVLGLADAPPALASGAAPPIVRRWDHRPEGRPPLVAGAIPITTDGWIALEDGIEVRFATGDYRVGDYWLIPARVATGTIIWPHDAAGQPLALPPRGIVHHYAPLFVVEATGAAPFVTLVEDCRCRFARLPCLPFSQ